MPLRIDVGELGKAETTPQGGIRVPAFLTRAGVFRYVNPDGTERREWRSVAEVSRADSLRTLQSAPVTIRHPKAGKVSTASWRQLSIGHVGDDVRLDGNRVAASVVINDAEGIEQVRAGLRETSSGYQCALDPSPGVVPAGEPDAGESYDMSQRNIVYNHVAILERGRAGRDIKLRLDADDNICDDDATRADDEESTMKEEIIDGVPYVVGTPAHAKARKDHDERLAKMRLDHDEAIKAADVATKELADEKEKRVAAEKRADAAEAQLKPEALSKRVAERAALVAVASKALAKSVKLDTMDDLTIRKAVVAKIKPHLRLDGASDEKIAAWYEDAAVEAVKPRTDAADGDELEAHRRAGKAADEVASGRVDEAIDGDADDNGGDEFERFYAQTKKTRADTAKEIPRWQRPTAMSKDSK